MNSSKSNSDVSPSKQTNAFFKANNLTKQNLNDNQDQKVEESKTQQTTSIFGINDQKSNLQGDIFSKNIFNTGNNTTSSMFSTGQNNTTNSFNSNFKNNASIINTGQSNFKFGSQNQTDQQGLKDKQNTFNWNQSSSLNETQALLQKTTEQKALSTNPFTNKQQNIQSQDSQNKQPEIQQFSNMFNGIGERGKQNNQSSNTVFDFKPSDNFIFKNQNQTTEQRSTTNNVIDFQERKKEEVKSDSGETQNEISTKQQPSSDTFKKTLQNDVSNESKKQEDQLIEQKKTINLVGLNQGEKLETKNETKQQSQNNQQLHTPHKSLKLNINKEETTQKQNSPITFASDKKAAHFVYQKQETIKEEDSIKEKDENQNKDNFQKNDSNQIVESSIEKINLDLDKFEEKERKQIEEYQQVFNEVMIAMVQKLHQGIENYEENKVLINTQITELKSFQELIPEQSKRLTIFMEEVIKVENLQKKLDGFTDRLEQTVDKKFGCSKEIKKDNFLKKLQEIMQTLTDLQEKLKKHKMEKLEKMSNFTKGMEVSQLVQRLQFLDLKLLELEQTDNQQLIQYKISIQIKPEIQQ